MIIREGKFNDLHVISAEVFPTDEFTPELG